jgi:hypothetical protein
MVPVRLDAADRHLLAVAAVWAVVVVVGLLGGAVVLGLAWRLFLWALGAG